ncbi:hypothetical protein CFOL_v3_27048 [Cephalotus follicularis]|uniref:Exo_endo_phos domain-containing protein n=1 Tax=Cephalotus follicularis TaxID=3775 RepID=A0A1Q3CTM3_CEPFO|nr:hypothetical protein CFOL_v3_27045 [Cephalotus follicularis]GAV83602.1 hypothetical protein CFOL_v3_27048 [Cephalotus follicularis]
MIVLSWNCRGLGNPRVVRALSDLTRKEVPNCVFLVETCLMTQEMEQIRKRLHFKNCLTVNPEGRKGGLAMLWDENLIARVVSFSNSHIDMIFGDNNSSDSWLLIGIYGQPCNTPRPQGGYVALLSIQYTKQWPGLAI